MLGRMSASACKSLKNLNDLGAVAHESHAVKHEDRVEKSSGPCTAAGGPTGSDDRESRSGGRRFAVAARVALCLALLLPSIPNLAGQAGLSGLLSRRGHSDSVHPDRPRSRALLSHSVYRGLRLRAVISRDTNQLASPREGAWHYIDSVTTDPRLFEDGDRPLHTLVPPPLRC